MEGLNPDKKFWKNKKVFISGHTGFKGSWLCLYLHHLGAEIYGYALEPHTDPNLFSQAGIDKLVNSTISDIRDENTLYQSLKKSQAEIVIHMAAQPLVRASYKKPKYTYETNIMGTINLLESIRKLDFVKVLINVTTDKCYDNKESLHPYNEKDALGGYDPYSSSKACSELVTSAYRNSFFNTPNVAIATARAGNVIGGGDWAYDRLIPDCIRSILDKKEIVIRYPDAIRPWQHVLEPLTAYLLLAEKLYQDKQKYEGAWNIGPNEEDTKTVEWIVKALLKGLGLDENYVIDKNKNPHEATILRLDSSKSNKHLGWYPHLSIKSAIKLITEYLNVYLSEKDIRTLCMAQIEKYLNKN